MPEKVFCFFPWGLLAVASCRCLGERECRNHGIPRQPDFLEKGADGGQVGSISGSPTACTLPLRTILGICGPASAEVLPTEESNTAVA